MLHLRLLAAAHLGVLGVSRLPASADAGTATESPTRVARVWQAWPVDADTTSSPLSPAWDADLDDLVDDWLPLPDVGTRLGIPANRARQLLTEGKLVAVRRGDNAALMVPARFLSGNAILKGLTGTLTVLRDAGYRPSEMIRWLYTADDSLPGRPIDALAENRGTEVKRRAQALGF